jgi:uncharacterized RDD family membrane protein YckC
MELENTNISSESSSTEQNLASRWSRLFAALIDGIIMIAVTSPIMYLSGWYDGVFEGVQPSITHGIIMSLVSIVIFVIINGKLLASSGQTIGKRLLGIKIVTLSGEKAGISNHLLKRYGTYFITAQIPMIGGLLSLLNVAFIFGSEKRCGHDLVADTKVVSC